MVVVQVNETLDEDCQLRRMKKDLRDARRRQKQMEEQLCAMQSGKTQEELEALRDALQETKDLSNQVRPVVVYVWLLAPRTCTAMFRCAGRAAIGVSHPLLLQRMRPICALCFACACVRFAFASCSCVVQASPLMDKATSPSYR